MNSYQRRQAKRRKKREPDAFAKLAERMKGLTGHTQMAVSSAVLGIQDTLRRMNERFNEYIPIMMRLSRLIALKGGPPESYSGMMAQAVYRFYYERNASEDKALLDCAVDTWNDLLTLDNRAYRNEQMAKCAAEIIDLAARIGPDAARYLQRMQPASVAPEQSPDHVS